MSCAPSSLVPTRACRRRFLEGLSVKHTPRRWGHLLDFTGRQAVAEARVHSPLCSQSHNGHIIFENNEFVIAVANVF